MSGVLKWLAVLYVALLPFGRSGLPLHAQYGDLVFPVLVLAAAGLCGGLVSRADWPLALYLLVTAMTAAVSPEPMTGVAHLAKQFYVAAIFVVFRRLAAEADLTERLEKTYVRAVAALTTLSILAVFVGGFKGGPGRTFGEVQVLPVLGEVRRLRGLFEAPEFLGNALLVAFLLALAWRGRVLSGKRAAWTAIAVLLAAGEFLTYSRSIAGFGVATVLFVSPGIRSRGLRVSAWIVALAVVLIVNVASVIGPAPKGTATHYEVGSVSFDLLGVKVEGRLMSYAALKQIAWSAFLDHPVSGIGPGRFPTETERAFAEGRTTSRYRSVPPHSDLSGRLAETGVPGGVSLVVLWLAWLRALRPGLALGTPSQRAAAAAVIGILVNSLNADVMNFRFLWLALAWATFAQARPDAAQGLVPGAPATVSTSTRRLRAPAA